MSIQSEITRIAGAKGDIAGAIEAKGVTVSSSTKIDGYATLISQIETPTAMTEQEILSAVQAGWV